MRLLVRLLVAMALLGGLIQFASFEYHQGMEEGLKLAALKERQDAVINATAKALSLEKAHAHAPEPVEGDDPDEEEPPPASPSLAEVDGHGAGSQPGNHSSPSLSARGRSSNETSGVAKRARGNGSSEGERKRQGGKDRKDPRPPCSLLTGVENASACVTRKGRTKAELDELKRLFDATRCKHPPTREIIMGVPLETLERIVKAKKTVITYGTQDWVKSKKRACKAATSKGAADTCLAMDESFMDGPFKAKNREILAKKRGGGLWLWKPYIINKTLATMNEGDYVVYHDAGAYLTGPVHPLMALMESGFHDPPLDGVLTFGVGFSQGRFCKRDTFIKQNCDTDVCHKAMQVDGYLSVWRKGPHAQRLIDMWLTDCQDFSILGDTPNKLQKPNLAGFKDHRHDQAILTNILSREGFGRDTSNGPATFMMNHDRRSNGAM